MLVNVINRTMKMIRVHVVALSSDSKIKPSKFGLES